MSTTGNGLVLHYHCLRKSATKCKAKCTLVCETVLTDNVENTKYRVEKRTEINEHNHDIDVIVADMMNEMHSKFRKNLTVKRSIVRKQTMQKFRAKYLDSETCRKVVDALPVQCEESVETDSVIQMRQWTILQGRNFQNL